MAFVFRLFDPAGFPARWECGPGWSLSPWVGWLHIVSDLGIWTAYFAIPMVLAFFVLRKRDLPFRSIFLLFVAFILLCGLTHLVDAIIFYYPIYRFAAVLKLATAVVSWSTVLALVQVVPGVLAMRSPQELEREIDARRSAEKALLHANSDLERRVAERTAELTLADHRKDEFLAMLAHELRNPLAPISNGLQILKRAEPGGELTDQARTMMERQLAQVVRLVDDLLDVSRITRNRLELRREQVSLAHVIAGAIETSRPLIEARGHTLHSDLPAEPVFLKADFTRLAQVFSNLLNNAAKYTERGGRIDITARREGASVVVSVRDNGMGIPAPMLPKVFDLYAQADRTLEHAQGGLGIGLTLARRLTEMHDGTVEARSAGKGHGTEFLVRLPVPAPDPAPSSPEHRNDAPDPPSQPARKILVVDDNIDSARSLATLLEMMGHTIRMAHDGHAAVEGTRDFDPDVILLDIGLPRRNGYDVCRTIREEPGGMRPTIVACTGWGQDEDRRRSQDAGFDFHLVKPIDARALEKLLAGELRW